MFKVSISCIREDKVDPNGNCSLRCFPLVDCCLVPCDSHRTLDCSLIFDCTIILVELSIIRVWFHGKKYFDLILLLDSTAIPKRHNQWRSDRIFESLLWNAGLQHWNCQTRMWECSWSLFLDQSHGFLLFYKQRGAASEGRENPMPGRGLWVSWSWLCTVVQELLALVLLYSDP